MFHITGETYSMAVNFFSSLNTNEAEFVGRNPHHWPICLMKRSVVYVLISIHQCQRSRQFRYTVEPWPWCRAERMQEPPLNNLADESHNYLININRYSHYYFENILTRIISVDIVKIGESILLRISEMKLVNDSVPVSITV